MKDSASLLLLFFSLGDEDELDWPNGGGNKGLFSNQPEIKNVICNEVQTNIYVTKGKGLHGYGFLFIFSYNYSGTVFEF